MFKSVIVALISLLMFSLVSCANKPEHQEEKTGQSIMEKIAKLDGVISVEAVENNQSEWLPEKIRRHGKAADRLE